MPKKERVRSQRSKGSWPFKSQEAAGVHRSRMICWSSFLDVLDFSKKKSEALNWGDYQMISRWTGVTFVEEAGLNHLRSATVTKHPISPWVPEIWALSDHFLEELTIDSFILDWSGTFLHPFPNIFRRISSFHLGTRTERWRSKAAICWTRWGVGWMDSSNSIKLIDSMLSFVFWGLEFPDAVGWCRKGSFDEVESLIDLLPGLLSLSSTGFDVMVHGLKWT